MEQLTRLWQRSRCGLMIMLGFLPAPLLITAFYVPQFLPWVWLWPLTYLLLDTAGTYVKGKARIWYVLFQLAVLAGLTFLTESPPKTLQVIFLAVMYAVLLLIGMPANAETRSDQSYLLRFSICGVLLHLIGQFLVTFHKATNISVVDPVAPWLTVGFLFFIFLALLLLNGANLTLMTQRRMPVSQVIRRKNGLMTLIIAAIALGAALIPGLVSLLRLLVRWLGAALQWLAEMLQRLQGGKGGNSGDSGSDELGELGEMMPPEEPADPWLKTVVTVFVILVTAVVVIWCLIFLGKKLVILARKIGRQTHNYLQAVSEDYIDEITDTRDGANPASRETKEKKLSAAQIRKLTPTEQIRYRYRLLLGKHPQWTAGSTARENLGENTAVIYEAVRYGGKEATEADARQFDDETKQA